ncbi:MarR family winged helix-turn-helix transcriptional regulator [Aurantibacillus circumpalustris]|uniref:MarR family winged helix-turn-helix transcriptional regulator n=1 Tax=Aurantibacillus circumpalustris TaxID=3036359 RepID=UPI00295A75CE|nr:MarR family transcriptional regulator [Aurantibacillus circumpalustris]
MSKKHTETVDSKLKTAWQVVSRMYNAEASLHDLTISMGHFLLNIDSHDGIYGSDLAPLLGMESTSLSRITLSLEKKKLIQRIPDKEDGRKMKIVLTTKGKAAKELAKNVVRNFNHLVEVKIGKNKVDDFFKTMDEITALAEHRNKLIKN